MIALEQRFKDLYNTYGGKSVRLVFYKKEYSTPHPSNTLVPSYRLYPSQMESDVVDFVIGDDMIHSDTLEITESLCSDEDLDFGACEAASMEIVASGSRYIKALYPHNGLYPSSVLVPADNLIGREFALVESFYSSDTIFPHNGLYPSDEFYPSRDITRGIFAVDSVPKEDDRDTRRIIAYDRMARFNKDVSEWYESMIFPMTLKRFRAALCSYVGISEVPASLVNDDLIVEKTLDTEVLNGRDLIRYICQINGVFGNINQNGEFRYVTISKSENIVDTITRYKTVDSEEYMVPSIDRVKIRQEEADVGGASTGEGNNFYVIEGNILAYNKTTAQLNAMANKILPVINGLEYRPSTIVGNGAPWYQMGDRVLVRTSDGDVNTIIMKRTSTGIQGPMDTIESTGSQELNQIFNIESQIIQTKGLVAKVKFTVEEVSSELINFEKETSTKFTQTAEQISLEAKRAQKAEEELSAKITITADSITSEVNKTITATETRLNSKITQTSEAITAEVNRASAAEGNLSTRITQTASDITFEVERAKGAEGTLSTRITQTATDITAEVARATQAEGSLSSRITINADSISTKVTKGTISSEISQEAGKITLSANRLIVNSDHFKLDGNGNATFSGTVDAAKITGSTITGNTISGGKVTGSVIEGAQFFGLSEAPFTAASGEVIIGQFYTNDKEYERSIFQSTDECTGMSAWPGEGSRLLLWAGWGHGRYDLDAVFLVNASRQAHVVKDFYIHGSRTINVYDQIMALWEAVGSGGGCGCDGDDEDCYSCSGHTSCYTCPSDHTACGPGASGTAN